MLLADKFCKFASWKTSWKFKCIRGTRNFDGIPSSESRVLSLRFLKENVPGYHSGRLFYRKTFFFHIRIDLLCFSWATHSLLNFFFRTNFYLHFLWQSHTTNRYDKPFLVCSETTVFLFLFICYTRNNTKSFSVFDKMLDIRPTVFLGPPLLDCNESCSNRSVSYFFLHFISKITHKYNFEENCFWLRVCQSRSQGFSSYDFHKPTQLTAYTSARWNSREAGWSTKNSCTN